MFRALSADRGSVVVQHSFWCLLESLVFLLITWKQLSKITPHCQQQIRDIHKLNAAAVIIWNIVWYIKDSFWGSR